MYIKNYRAVNKTFAQMNYWHLTYIATDNYIIIDHTNYHLSFSSNTFVIVIDINQLLTTVLVIDRLIHRMVSTAPSQLTHVASYIRMHYA